MIALRSLGERIDRLAKARIVKPFNAPQLLDAASRPMLP